MSKYIFLIITISTMGYGCYPCDFNSVGKIKYDSNEVRAPAINAIENANEQDTSKSVFDVLCDNLPKMGRKKHNSFFADSTIFVYDKDTCWVKAKRIITLRSKSYQEYEISSKWGGSFQ